MRPHFILFLFLLTNAFAQLQSDRFYKTELFLENLSAKNYISYDNFFRPHSFMDLNKTFDSISNFTKTISSPERKNLIYLREIYKQKICPQSENDSSKNISFFYKDRTINFLEYADENLFLRLNPAVTLGYISGFDKNAFYTGWGFYLTGSHKSGLSFNFSFNDNIFRNDYWLNKIDYLNNLKKVLTRNSKNRSEFSDTRGSITFQNDWILLGVIKDNIKIGRGENSQFILSNRAPSFTALFYRLDLTDWFNVYTYHGWLMSGIEDSSRSYNTDYKKRIVEHEKYFSMHAFQFRPVSNLSLTFGETIIYSDRGPYIGYMLPFIFFRSIDHMWSFGSEDSGNNGSFFFDFSAYLFNKIKLYSSVFIDELSFSKILKGDTDRNQFGYQVGVKVFNLFGDISRLTLEYTRILPWVYSNWIPAQTYTNLGYLMGHYIGQNSDQLYGKIDYIFIPELNFIIDFSYTRNGGISDIKNQYTSPGESFLYGDVRKILYTSLKIRYEASMNLIGEFSIQYFNVKDDSSTRTPDWQLGNNYLFEFRLNYFLENW